MVDFIKEKESKMRMLSVPRIRVLTVIFYIIVTSTVILLDPPYTLFGSAITALWIFGVGVVLNTVLNKHDIGF